MTLPSDVGLTATKTPRLTSRRFAGLRNHLGELRASARYLRADFGLEATEASELLALLKEMQNHVEAVRPKRALGVRAPRGYRVVAARDLRAGELILETDTRIFS